MSGHLLSYTTGDSNHCWFQTSHHRRFWPSAVKVVGDKNGHHHLLETSGDYRLSSSVCVVEIPKSAQKFYFSPSKTPLASHMDAYHK